MNMPHPIPPGRGPVASTTSQPRTGTTVAADTDTTRGPWREEHAGHKRTRPPPRPPASAPTTRHSPDTKLGPPREYTTAARARRPRDTRSDAHRPGTPCHGCPARPAVGHAPDRGRNGDPQGSSSNRDQKRGGRATPTARRRRDGGTVGRHGTQPVIRSPPDRPLVLAVVAAEAPPSPVADDLSALVRARVHAHHAA